MKDKSKKRTKSVIWMCDKPNCKHINPRIVDIGHVINDDKCDKCGCTIHEPITKTIITNG